LLWVAGDGTQALQLTMVTTLDLILLDAQGLGGFDLCRALKAEWALRSLSPHRVD